MPLEQINNNEALNENIATENKVGKEPEQSVAIAYSIQQNFKPKFCIINDGSRYGELSKQVKLDDNHQINFTTLTGKDAIAYFKKMTPEEYINECAKIMDIDVDMLIESRQDENLKWLRENISSGNPVRIPYIDYTNNYQDGLHRAIILKELNVPKLIVMVIEENKMNKQPKEEQNMKDDKNKIIAKAKEFGGAQKQNGASGYIGISIPNSAQAESFEKWLDDNGYHYNTNGSQYYIEDNAKLKDSTTLSKWMKKSKGVPVESAIIQHNKGVTFLSGIIKEDRDFSGVDEAETYAKSLGYKKITDSEDLEIRDGKYKVGQKWQGRNGLIVTLVRYEGNKPIVRYGLTEERFTSDFELEDNLLKYNGYKMVDSIKDATSQRYRFSTIDLYQDIEWGTPKGSITFELRNGRIIAEVTPGGFESPYYKSFANITELNRWLAKPEHDLIDSVKDVDINRLNEVVANYDKYVAKLKATKSQKQTNEHKLARLKVELNSYLKYSAQYGAAKSTDEIIRKLKKQISDLEFMIPEQEEDISALESMLKEADEAKSKQDSAIKDVRWEVGRRVRYEGEWYYIINYSRGTWILENENDGSQVRLNDSFKDSYSKYKGYDIEYDFYGEGEYTVQYRGDDIWFKTEKEAKDFIDKVTKTVDTNKVVDSEYSELRRAIKKWAYTDGRTSDDIFNLIKKYFSSTSLKERQLAYEEATGIKFAEKMFDSKNRDSVESDFSDITNMSDAREMLKKYGIELIKKDNRNYQLKKGNKVYTFYVLDNPNEVRADLVRAVKKLTDSKVNDANLKNLKTRLEKIFTQYDYSKDDAIAEINSKNLSDDEIAELVDWVVEDLKLK